MTAFRWLARVSRPCADDSKRCIAATSEAKSNLGWKLSVLTAVLPAKEKPNDPGSGHACDKSVGNQHSNPESQSAPATSSLSLICVEEKAKKTMYVARR